MDLRRPLVRRTDVRYRLSLIVAGCALLLVWIDPQAARVVTRAKLPGPVQRGPARMGQRPGMIRESHASGPKDNQPAEGHPVYLPGIAACGSKSRIRGPVAPATPRDCDDMEPQFSCRRDARTEPKFVWPVELSAADQDRAAIAPASQPEDLVPAPRAAIPTLVGLRWIDERELREASEWIDGTGSDQNAGRDGPGRGHRTAGASRDVRDAQWTVELHKRVDRARRRRPQHGPRDHQHRGNGEDHGTRHTSITPPLQEKFLRPADPRRPNHG